MKVLITSGGTKVPIDDVRDITNMSHGTFGAKICRQFLKQTPQDAEVWYLGSKDGCRPLVTQMDFSNPFQNQYTRQDAAQMDAMWEFYFEAQHNRHKLRERFYRSYADYATTLQEMVCTIKPDIIVLAAAVSDYVVANPVQGKVRSSEALEIHLKPAEKLIGQIKKWHPGCKLVGFKLLVGASEEELWNAAWKSICNNGCDMVVANEFNSLKAGEHWLMLAFRPGNRRHVMPPEDLAATVVAESLKL